MERRILVPVDDSDQATRAFDFALESFPDASITVLHVVDVVDLFQYADADLQSDDLRDIERTERLRRKLAEDHLERLRNRAIDWGADVETVVQFGRPARTIVSFARENDIDHIVMGSHARSGVSRILLGSIAETVARRSPTPVTIVR